MGPETIFSSVLLWGATAAEAEAAEPDYNRQCCAPVRLSVLQDDSQRAPPATKPGNSLAGCIEPVWREQGKSQAAEGR